MSGHSKWSTIKRQKGMVDAKRGQIFTKMAMAITLAVKLGNSGDPNANPRLRFALDQAKGVNMPKDNIDRAVERGLGKGKEALEEVTYEGFGPGRVAFYAEGVTDNKLRTNAEIRNLFERSGGVLAGQGSTAYMFDKKGEIIVISKGGKSEDEMLELIDLGVEDVEEYQEDGVNKYLLYTDSVQLNEVSNKVAQSGYQVESTQSVFKPNITVQIADAEMVKKVTEFAEKLEDHSDIQKVYANFDIAEELS